MGAPRRDTVLMGEVRMLIYESFGEEDAVSEPSLKRGVKVSQTKTGGPGGKEGLLCARAKAQRRDSAWCV